MKKVFRRWLVPMVTSLTIVGLAAPAGAAPFAIPSDHASAIYYLAVGASESVGVMPTTAEPKGQKTDLGYVNDVASSISQLGYDVTTYQAGCPGLSAAATISGTRCNGDGISSLQRALNFLTLHVNDHVIVTVDLGFNDLRFCRASEFKNPSCALKVMPQIEQSVTTVIQALQSVAGPNTTIYGMTHDNPYLGRSASGNSSLAAQSVPAMNSLNDTLRRVYAANNVGLVDVAAAFETSNVQPMYLTGMGVVPTNVARICTYTFICAMPPYGPNLHPNVAGYQVIAQTIMSVLSL